jgi:succinoglycan biosynthesis protein ExoM
MNEPKPHISVCICTYKRPDYLKRLLQDLARQKTDDLFTFSIVVADNDKAQSAGPVVAEFAASSPVKIVYCVQPEQNIALTRNKAADNASGDFLATIDDDEFPIEAWLLNLFRTCIACGVDGVLGPVKPLFEQQPPAWIIKGKFYDRPTHATGFIIDWKEGRTGNLLFKRSILQGIREPFCPAFGSGSEDTEFFNRMIGKGFRFAWCDEAEVYEIVPPERWKRNFMFRRALMRGRNSLKYSTGRISDVARSLIAVPLYTLALPVLLLMGHHLFIKYLVKLLDHSGRLLALLRLDPMGEKYVTK